ncbi:MAG: hypothetical protein K9K88_02130 [Desulfobacterales bacterium]|nr:hypothetical protein [Desulfobacterales bacterium]
MYGRAKTLKNLDERRAGRQGEAEHEEAVSEQKEEAAKQAEKEEEYRKKRTAGSSDETA